MLSLSFSFAAINGVDDFVGGQYNPLYHQRVNAMVRLLQRGAGYRQIFEWDFDATAIAKEKVRARDMVAAFRMGFSFVEEDGGANVRLARYRLVVALILPDPDDPELIDALEDLGVTPGRSQYVLRPPTHSTPGEHDSYAIWVVPRSMHDVLNLAARFVEVPAVHAGIVPGLEKVAADSLTIPTVASDQLPTLQALARTDKPFFRLADTQEYMNCALANLQASDGSLSWLDQRIGALRSGFQMHAQDKTNRRLNLLTILSAIFTPVTLLAGIWGMNFEIMPELKYPFAYPIALGFMALVGWGMYLFFRRNDWLD